MDIKYFMNRETGRIEAVNIDNVKRIYVEWNYDDKSLSTLYFDDMKIHNINKESFEDDINRIVSSEEKILKIYNSNIIKKFLNDRSKELIYNGGFIKFKDYIMSADVNHESVITAYKLVGVKAYIQYMKTTDVIGSDKTTKYIVSFLLVYMYITSQNQFNLNLENINDIINK